jgi:hypothetical protein
MLYFLSLLLILNIENSESIPFNFYENKIIVEGLINGVQKTFIIDTGAPSFIRKSKMDDTTKIYRQLKFGSLEFDSLQFLVNTYDFDSDKFENIYGVLGYDFLYRYNLFIDWDVEMLIFKNRGTQSTNRTASSAKYTLPFLFENSPPKLTLQINDSFVQPGISFDTGSGQGIFLENSFYKLYAQNLDSSRLNKKAFSFTDVSGKHSGFYDTIEFDSLKIGNLKLTNETIMFNESHSNIGLKYFLDYNIEINWDSKNIYLFERVK